ncbi:MAG: methyltransferase domain-containing protein [Candidatus Omnitrophica bacterium]|nr:methyltransferase domain-containing protein [Candidatus Omnitrophota bacterium]MDD5429310.1 methyltransferase domain-containing protein [Candidatus Omnitrophota bacterium]
MIDYRNFKIDIPATLYDCGNRLRRRKMLSLLPDTKNKIILELGCGIGDFFIALNQRKAAYKEYIGIDISFANLLTAKRLISKFKPLDNISFMKADIFKLPFQDESADILICAEVLEHLDDIEAIKEITRVLKKEGFVLITVPYLGEPVRSWGHLRHYDLNMVKFLAEKSGLVIKKVNVFGRFHEITWVKFKRVLYKAWGLWKKVFKVDKGYYESTFHRYLIMPVWDKILVLDDVFYPPQTILGNKGYLVALMKK